MKELTDKHKKLARFAVNALKRLQDEGVSSIVIDGGDNEGLTFPDSRR